LPGLVGCIQALETIKLILGEGKPLVGRMIHFDTMTMDVRVLKLRRDPNCVVCGEHPTVTDLIDYEGFCSGVSSVTGNGNGAGHPAERDSERPHA
jgi:adenylyltransferase/sulfurtransferase